jgi:hypothetical protein
MFNVTGLFVVATAGPLALELAELLLPQAASERAPMPRAPALSASRRVIMLSVMSLSSVLSYVVKQHCGFGLPAEQHQCALFYLPG